MKDSAVIDFGCVSSRIFWIKFRFSRVKICLVVEYGSNEGDDEERDRLWNNMTGLWIAEVMDINCVFWEI